MCFSCYCCYLIGVFFHYASLQIGVEVLKSHTTATIANLSSNCKLLVRGPGAKKALEWICVGDLNKPRNSCVKKQCIFSHFIQDS